MEVNKKGSFQKESGLPSVIFQGRTVSFPGRRCIFVGNDKSSRRLLLLFHYFYQVFVDIKIHSDSNPPRKDPSEH